MNKKLLKHLKDWTDKDSTQYYEDVLVKNQHPHKVISIPKYLDMLSQHDEKALRFKSQYGMDEYDHCFANSWWMGYWMPQYVNQESLDYIEGCCVWKDDSQREQDNPTIWCTHHAFLYSHLLDVYIETRTDYIELYHGNGNQYFIGDIFNQEQLYKYFRWFLAYGGSRPYNYKLKPKVRCPNKVKENVLAIVH